MTYSDIYNHISLGMGASYLEITQETIIRIRVECDIGRKWQQFYTL